MFQILKSIRNSLVESFRDGVLWRESVVSRDEDDLFKAANANARRRFVPENQNEEDDPIIQALRGSVTPEAYATIHAAVSELRSVQDTIQDQEAIRASLETIVADQRIEISNLMVRLDASQKDIETLRRAITNHGEDSPESSYDIAIRALKKSRQREAELRNLASGVTDTFSGSNYKPITTLDYGTRQVLRDAIAKEAMETYDGIGSYAISDDHSKWEAVADAVLETLILSGISVPEGADPDVYAKVTNAIFQAFCVHYGLDPNPSMYEMGMMPDDKIEHYDRLRNASRVAANAVLGKHLDEKVRPWTKDSDISKSIFVELDKKSLTTPDDVV